MAKNFENPKEFDEVYSKLGVESVEVIVVERHHDLIQARMHFADNDNEKTTHTSLPPPSQAAISTPRKNAAGDDDSDSDTNSNLKNIHSYNTPKPQRWTSNLVWFIFVYVVVLVDVGYFLSGLWSTLSDAKVIA